MNIDTQANLLAEREKTLAAAFDHLNDDGAAMPQPLYESDLDIPEEDYGAGLEDWTADLSAMLGDLSVTLAGLRSEYEKGNRLALFDAARLLALAVGPDAAWVHDKMTAGVHRYRFVEEDDDTEDPLGAAFFIERAENFQRPAQRHKRKWLQRMLNETAAALGQHAPKKTPAYEAAAENLPSIEPKTVGKWWRDNQELLKIRMGIPPE